MKRIIIILLAFLSTAAFADVEIIVTASRIEEDSKTTPAYVRVIPEEEIDKNTTVLDVLKTIPDISVGEYSPAKQSISMGGFGANGFARTLVLVNGRSVNRPDMASFDWNSITLSSVSRIEIVKGSLSSQYGDQAVAGVINIITKQPEGLTATVSASVANTFTNNESVFLSYGNKKTGLAVGINRTDNTPTRDRSNSTILSTNIDSFYNFAGIETKLGVFYSDTSYQLPGGLTKEQYETDPDQAVNQEDKGISNSYGVNGSVLFSLGLVDFSIPLSYSQIKTSTDWGFFSSYSDTILNMATAELKVSSSSFIGESIEISPIGGIDFNKNTILVDKYADEDRTVLSYSNEVSRYDSAVWARIKANYLDTFIIEGGARYNYSYLDTDPSVSHSEPVYDAGIVYIASPALRFTFRYGRVFRYPLLDEQVSYYSAGPITVNTDLIPEKGNSYTASIDYTINNLRITLSPYLLDMEDEIVFNNNTYINENTGPTIHYGSSIEAAYSVGIIDFVTGYAYDHGEFADTNKTMPLISENNIFGSIAVTPLKFVTISTDGRFSSEFYQGSDVDNVQETISGRFEWNIRVDWKVTDDFSWYAKADNILDDRTPTLANWSSWNSQSSMYPMPGRTFETGIKWVY